MTDSNPFPHTDQMLRELETIARAAKVNNHGVDFIYVPPDGLTSCRYVHYDGAGERIPGCLFGWWLTTVRGVPLPELEERETANIIDFIGGYVELDNATLDIAMFVQHSQDTSQCGWLAAVQGGRKRFATRFVAPLGAGA